jgi:phosphoesterase RecJ-like protein
MTWQSTASFDDLAARINSAETIVCTTHARPDGDAMGSVLALVRALNALGKQASGLFMGPVPAALQQLVGDTPVRTIESIDELGDVPCDLVIIADTGAWTQVKLLEDWLRSRADRVIVIDHHASGDEDISATRFVDASAASATVIVLQLLEHMGLDLGRGDESVAEALFAGLATDTGWFRQANADAAAFSAASRLLNCGVNKNRLYRLIEETARPQRLALQACLLASVEWIAAGRGAILRVTAEDFNRTGGRRDELTGLVNEPLVVGGVEFSVLMVEDKPCHVKLSMRSKPPRTRGGNFVDVRKVTGFLGGGGHVHASGARVEGDLAMARMQVLEALAKAGVIES